MKKIIALILVFLICLTMVGCNKNPSNNSVFSENSIEIIVEEIITEVQSVTDTTSETESNVTENNSSQQNNSSQAQTSQPTPSQTTSSQSTPPAETKNVIPEGGTYKVYRTGDTLIAGQEFPQASEANDVYIYGDYKYRYDNTIAGWRVKVLDKTKSRYGKILDSINGKAIKSMGGTSLTPPDHPQESECEATFLRCTELIEAPDIPSTVIDLDYTFFGCESLTTAPTIPSSVTNMKGTFGGCESLTTAPAIPSSVTNMYATFGSCESLTTAPAIPSSVTNMDRTFSGCESLTTAPAIPSSVTNMELTFSGCTSLSGTITINANPTQYDYCFRTVDMSKITLTGSATKETLNNIGATGENYTPIP